MVARASPDAPRGGLARAGPRRERERWTATSRMGRVPFTGGWARSMGSGCRQGAPSRACRRFPAAPLQSSVQHGGGVAPAGPARAVTAGSSAPFCRRASVKPHVERSASESRAPRFSKAVRRAQHIRVPCDQESAPPPCSLSLAAAAGGPGRAPGPGPQRRPTGRPPGTVGSGPVVTPGPGRRRRWPGHPASAAAGRPPTPRRGQYQ